MTRGIFSSVALALTIGIVSMSAAHHPPKMERRASVSFSGQIEQIEWRPPHVELLIRTDGGLSRRVTWLSINQLTLADIHRDTLKIGDTVNIAAGIQLDDLLERPMLLSYIHRASDGWGWSQVPQGC